MNRGLNKHVQCMRNSTIQSILTVVLLFVFLPEFGIYGYLACFAVTRVLGFFLGAVLLMKASGCTPGLAFVLKTVLCTITSFAASYWFHVQMDSSIGVAHTVIHGGIILVTYGIFLILFRVIRREEIHWLISFLKP